jgi:hypothetical protein
MKKITSDAKSEDDICHSKNHAGKYLCTETDICIKKPFSRANIIHLKERNFGMLKKDLILKNPLMGIGSNGEDILPKSGFGAVLARAGVGKTSLLVQLALFNQLNGKNVLHISLNDPVAKVSLWYDEVFRNIADQYGLKQMNRLWESILPHRFIMTFKASGFNVSQFEERLNDLTEQDIFLPQLVIIDGLSFDEPVRDTISELKSLAAAKEMAIWFTVQTHRHETTPSGKMPVQLNDISNLFNVIIQLKPVDKEILLEVLKSSDSPKGEPNLILDPATMLVKTK